MTLPDWLSVIERPFPSSVLAVIRGPRPIVVDPGSLTDADQLPGLFEDGGVDQAEVGLVLCTHYHSDHVGAVATLQQTGVEVAAHAWDAGMVNARDPGACASRWLAQPVLPYRVNRALREGDVVSTNAVDLHVIHTPGHTLGGISLWEPESRTLLCGDALHARDTPWIGTPHEGAGSIPRALLTLDRIEELDPVCIASGHGPVIDDVVTAIARTQERLAGWQTDPAAGALYAAKRILTYRLMLEPIPTERIDDLVYRAPWLRDLAARLDEPARTFAQRLLDSLASSLFTKDGALRTTAPHRPSPIPVPWELTQTHRWPSLD
jgi:glyoxylase-like metal-dependent hydrolase (beta-lactamase superfamily II)